MRPKALKIFCAESSIHGIPYLSNDDVHLIEKIFWTIFTIFSFICCFLLIGKIVEILRDDPTMIYSSDVAVPVSEIPFPAVTLCFDLLSYGNVTYSLYHVIKQKLENGQIKVHELSENTLKNLQAISLIISDDFLLNHNISRISTTDIPARLLSFTLSIRGLFIKSTFGDYFSTVLADVIGPSGICYNFNMVDAQNLYKNVQNATKSFRYNHDFPIQTRIDKYYRRAIQKEELNLTNPLKIPGGDSSFKFSFSGSDKAFEYSLEQQMRTYDFYKFAAPQIYIHNPFEVYSKDINSYFGNLEGKVTYIVEPKQMIIDDNLKESGPEARGCYFNADDDEHGEDERTLKYFNIYTKGNCKQECLINRTLEVCGCVQFFMIHGNLTQVCGIHDMKCYKSVEEELLRSDLCQCFPSCGEIVYNVQRIVSSLVKPIPVKESEGHMSESRPSKHYSFTVVKFKSSSYFPYVLKRQFTEIDFIAYTGGAFGLFLGISITSFVEIFYYFTIRLAFGWLRGIPDTNKVESTSSDESGENLSPEVKKTSKLSYFKYYFSISTVHGMNQIVMDYRHFVERSFWILCLGLSLVYCGISSYEMYEKFQQSTIAITYDSDEDSVKTIPFPAVFFTPEITIPNKIVYYAWYLKKLYNKHTFEQLKGMGVLYIYITNSFMCEFKYALDELTEHEDPLYKDYNLINEIFIRNKTYWFKNQTAIWNDRFQPEMVNFLGRSGHGFSFNMLEPGKMFRDDVSSNFSKIHTPFSFNTSEESRHLDLIPRRFYPLNAHEKSSFQLKITKSSLALFKNVCQFPFFNIHSPFEMPNDIDDENSFSFFYGQDLEVLITPNVIKSDENLRKFTPEKRNCYFEGEKILKFFKIYTRRNCEMECLAEYYLNHNRTECVPYYLIRNETNPICTVNKYFNIKIIKFQFDQKNPKVPNSKALLDSCGCLETCNDIKYNIEVVERKISGENKELDFANMTIKFRYKNDKFLPLVRRISFTFEDFLCQAGGLLGLYAGISALSVVELMYFVTLRPVFNFYGWTVKQIRMWTLSNKN